MKKYINFIVTLFFLPAIGLTACMQWDNTEGPFFGSWHLETIDIDGVEDSAYTANIMISFEAKIFNLAYLSGITPDGNSADGSEIYGSWSYAGEVLTLDAGYNAGSGALNQNLFNPFPVVLHFPADVSQIEITVTSIGKKTMQWQYIDQNGQLLTYNFRKYP